MCPARDGAAGRGSGLFVPGYPDRCSPELPVSSDVRLIAKPTGDSGPSKLASLTVTARPGPPNAWPLASPRWKEASMLRTARLTEAMRAHGKTMAVAAAAAGVLAGAGGASAALTSSPAPATHLAAAHAGPGSQHSAVTTAHLSASGKSKKQPAAATPKVTTPI